MKKLTTEDFISKAREVHGDKYDYSKTEYVNNKTPICIICPEHGEFKQTPYPHLRGCGCAKCGEKVNGYENGKFIYESVPLQNVAFEIYAARDIVSPDGKKISLPFFSHMFSVAVEAPRDDKISYAKIIAFICWLRKSGYNIARISRDQFQSEYVAQELEQKGFTVDKISLDRTPDGYGAMHTVLIEERIDMLDSKLLQDELIHLQRDLVTGRLDHPIGGGKDAADAMAGWVWNATLHNDGVPVATSKKVNAMLAVNTGRNNPTKQLQGLFNNSIRTNETFMKGRYR